MTVNKSCYFRQFFFITIVLISTFACRPGRCDPPSETFGTLTFRQLWNINAKFGTCDYSNTLLDRLDANDLAKEKDETGAGSKWIAKSVFKNLIWLYGQSV